MGKQALDEYFVILRMKGHTLFCNNADRSKIEVFLMHSWRCELVSFTVGSQHHKENINGFIQFEMIGNNAPKLFESFFASWEACIKSMMLRKKFDRASDLNTVDCWRSRHINKNNIENIETTGNLNQISL